MRTSPSKDDVWLATERGDVEAVRRFVEARGVPNIAKDDYDGANSLLSVACRAGQVEVVRYFMEIGYRDPGAPFDPQVPHLFAAKVPHAFAALEENHLDVLRVLCEFDLDVNAPSNKHGESLTEQAVYDRNLEALQLLLQFGGEISLHYDQDDGKILDSLFWPNGYCPPPLEVASLAGDEELVEFLLRAYPDHSADQRERYLERTRQNEWKHQQKRAEQERLLARMAQTKTPEYSRLSTIAYHLEIVLAMLLFPLMYLADKIQDIMRSRR